MDRVGERIPVKSEPSGGAILAMLPATRRELLLRLKVAGEARAEDLAAQLNITVSGVRQHLTTMAADGLVAHRELKAGPGRPKFTYHLTPSAEALFPRAYSDFANELLASVEEEDPALVERLFARRLDRRVARARDRLDGLDLRAKVSALAEMLDSEGYLATVEDQPDGSFLLSEHNCAVLGVASRFAPICASELEFVRAILPEADVDRVTHILSGAYSCAYAVRPKLVAGTPTRF